MNWRQRQPRPECHRDRASRTVEEFARAFSDSLAERQAAEAVVLALAAWSSYDLSGLEPSDRIGDVIGSPDALDLVEAVMAAASEGLGVSPDEPAVAAFDLVLQRRLLGEQAPETGWHSSLIRERSVRAVILERARLERSQRRQKCAE